MSFSPGRTTRKKYLPRRPAAGSSAVVHNTALTTWRDTHKSARHAGGLPGVATQALQRTLPSATVLQILALQQLRSSGVGKSRSPFHSSPVLLPAATFPLHKEPALGGLVAPLPRAWLEYRLHGVGVCRSRSSTRHRLLHLGDAVCRGPAGDGFTEGGQHASSVHVQSRRIPIPTVRCKHTLCSTVTT